MAKRKPSRGPKPRPKKAAPSTPRSEAAKRAAATRKERARILTQLEEQGVEGALKHALVTRILEGRKIPKGNKKRFDKHWSETFRIAGRQMVDLHEGRFYSK